MATTTTVASADAPSGGKIMRGRRTAGFRSTPYDRPSVVTSPSQDTGAPNHVSNWLSRFILSPSRYIANGAGKVLATVFGSDSPSASESSSDTSSEEDMDTTNSTDCTNFSPDNFKEVNETSNIVENPHNFSWSTDSKRKIANLLSHETYSREESVALKRIIEARVIRPPIVPGFGLDDDHSNLHSCAVIEAKKWLERKKSDSISKLDVEHGQCHLNSSFEPQNMSETELILPVNVAKSYMESLPPWASPPSCTRINDIGSTGMHSTREISPHSHPGNVLKLPKQSPLSGSWSLQEELRKVRFKSSEDLLKNRSPSRTDWSPLSLNRRIGLASPCDGMLSPDTCINNQSGIEILDNDAAEGKSVLLTASNLNKKDSATETTKSVFESDNLCNNGTAPGSAVDQSHQEPSKAGGEAPEVAANGLSVESSIRALTPPNSNHFDRKKPSEADKVSGGQPSTKRGKGSDMALKKGGRKVSRYNRRVKKKAE